MKNIVIMIKKVIEWVNRNSNKLLFLLILIVGITITHSLFKKDNDIITPTIIDYQEVQKWKDKYNNEHNTVSQLQLERDVFKRQVDSQARILGVKPKDVQSVTSLTTRVDTFFKSKLVYIDSLKSFGFSKKDNYLALSGLINREDSTISLKLSTKDTLTFIPYIKRGFFKQTHVVDVSNKNPYNKIVSGYSYAQTERVKRWGIGPHIGYDPINNKVTYGIGVQYSIIRF